MINLVELSGWITTVLAFLVSVLTLYNAAKLKSGIIAVSTYASGAGMIIIAAGFFLRVVPTLIPDPETLSLLYNLSLIAGFSLMGVGSFKIYQMSRIK